MGASSKSKSTKRQSPNPKAESGEPTATSEPLDLSFEAVTEIENVIAMLELIPVTTSLSLMAAEVLHATPPEHRDSIAQAAKEHFGIDIDVELEEATDPGARMMMAMEIPDTLAEMASWRLRRLLELLVRARRAGK